jgi:hypothetical protein
MLFCHVDDRVSESGEGQLQGVNYCCAGLAGIVGPTVFGAF